MTFGSSSRSISFGGGYPESQYVPMALSMRCLRDEEETAAEASPLQILLWQLQQRINDLQNTQGKLEAKLFTCGEQMKDADGNLYNTIRMGTQCWMAENLRTTRYSDGTEIALGTDTSSSVAYRYSHSENTPPSTFGYAYNWKAILHGETPSSANPSGVRGVCPLGWHVPSMAEWDQLAAYVQSRNEYVCGSSAANIAKALAATSGWLSSTTTCAVGNTPSDNNATGFNIVCAPWRSPSGYSQSKFVTALATCTQQNSQQYTMKQISSSNATFFTSYPYFVSGTYVRCVADLPVDTAADSPALPQGATVGDMLYWNGNDWQVLPVGQQGQHLVMDSGTPTWQTPADNALHYILFNANGGNGSMNAQFFPNGVQQTVSANTFTRSGFIFTGWNTAADGTGTSYNNEAVLTLTENIALYAQWTNASGGTTPSDSTSSSSTTTSCVVSAIHSNETGSGGTITAVRDHQNNSYAVVQIGSQCWLKENMRCTTSPTTGANMVENPAVVANVSPTVRRAYYYGNNPANAANGYGLLYNWPAAMDGSTTGGTRGICPEGWHLPTDAEWTTLMNTALSIYQQEVTPSPAFGSQDEDSEGNNTAISSMLSGSSDWTVYNDVPNCPGNNSNPLRNATGFSAVPSGNYDGAFNSRGQAVDYWSSSAYDSGTAWIRVWFYYAAGVVRAYDVKGSAFAVRCIRN